VARQSIWAGLGLSAIAMVFAALGHLPATAGAILQEVIDVAVILNALRASGEGAGRPMTTDFG
jgi:cation transport ATPase